MASITDRICLIRKTHFNLIFVKRADDDVEAGEEEKKVVSVSVMVTGFYSTSRKS